jgi:hypothetical protein
MHRRAAGALVALACVAAAAPRAAAQAIELAPFVGYRFGGDVFEIMTGVSQDVDGAPSAGASCDVPLHDGLSLEIFYARQAAHVFVPAAGPRPLRVNASTEYWHAGGLQEFVAGSARPFLTGTLGLTRVAVGGDDELRFSVGAGGGVKLRASDHLAVRLDGRLLVTFMDGSFTTVICTSGGCLAGLHLSAIWQTDFTAGLAFTF